MAIASTGIILSRQRTNKGADQTAQMHRLICTFVVCILHKTHFRMTWPMLDAVLFSIGSGGWDILAYFHIYFINGRFHRDKYFKSALNSCVCPKYFFHHCLGYKLIG